MIEARDTGGDQHRQQEVADKIFAALRSSGHWPTVYRRHAEGPRPHEPTAYGHT
jgi:hypothetical protein